MSPSPLTIPLVKEPDTTATAPVGTLATSVVESVPPAVNGLALGLCGLTGLWSQVGAHLDVRREAIIVVCVLLALVLQLCYVIKAIACTKAFVKEFSQLQTVAALATFPMGLSILAKMNCGYIGNEIGLAIVVVATFLHVVCMMRFLQLAFVARLLPEPFWFPPTVGLSVPVMSGHACGWDPSISLVGFFIVLFYVVVLVPVVSFRIAFWEKWKVAPNPSCNILAAPVSLATMMWHTIGRPWSNIFGLILFAISTVVLIQTWFALFVRRRTWLHQPFTPAWAAFTFPLTASVSEAQMTWKWFAPESAPFEAYVTFLLLLCTSVVGYTTLRFVSEFLGCLQGNKPIVSVPRLLTIDTIDPVIHSRSAEVERKPRQNVVEDVEGKVTSSNFD